MGRNEYGAIATVSSCEFGSPEHVATRSSKKILIVDDEPFVRNVMRKFFENEGFTNISEAEDGDESVVVSRKLNPDIIMMDYYMKGTNGLSATRKIKEEMPDIKVIVMTGSPKPSIVTDCMAAGASSFIIKPVNRRGLMNAIKSRI